MAKGVHDGLYDSDATHLRAGGGVGALRKRSEVKLAVVHAAFHRRRERHERRLHVIQGALHQAVVVLRRRRRTERHGRIQISDEVRARKDRLQGTSTV